MDNILPTSLPITGEMLRLISDPVGKASSSLVDGDFDHPRIRS